MAANAAGPSSMVVVVVVGQARVVVVAAVVKVDVEVGLVLCDQLMVEEAH